MRLAHFIRENADAITEEWEKFAGTLNPDSDDKSPRALRNHIKYILAFITDDLQTPQSSSEQIEKSHGKKAKAPEHSPAETHAAIRLAGGFDMDQMVSEYRALRASVIKLWGARLAEPTLIDFSDLIRFNEAVDQELTESINHYTKKTTESKDLFLGILSHDLRNPLGSITMSAALTLKIGALQIDRLC